MSMKRCRIHIRTTVPPGSSLVGVFPHTLFRIERAKLPDLPGLWLGTAIGQYIPFDGHIHDVRGHYGTTLTIGAMFSFCVRNDHPEPRPLEFQVGGTAVDWTTPEVSHGLVLGLFAQEYVDVPERDEEAEAELVVSVLPRLIPELDEAGLARLTDIIGLSLDEVKRSLSSVEGREKLVEHLLARTECRGPILKDTKLTKKPTDDGLGFVFTVELFETLESRHPENMKALLAELGMSREQAITALGTPDGQERLSTAIMAVFSTWTMAADFSPTFPSTT